MSGGKTMARHLPARTVFNGLETGKTGRDHKGRFVAGVPLGPGRPVANPFARYQAELRAALLAEVTPADVRTILRKVIRIAKRGHLPAVELLLRWVLGGPPPARDPDTLDADEMRVRKGKPTLVDWLSLADEQADRAPVAIPATAAEEPDDADPRAPSLRTVLAWAIQELAEAQTALRASHSAAPDPAAGWEAFAASRLEWDAQAAVPTDLFFLAYARWCASHGAPVLPEDEVLAWLTAHGATVRTGALSQVAAVEGVRVVD
jgi:hypothetical protein